MNYDKMAKQNKPCLFSSRRRNTRWTGDWSSDVCSSDLTAVLELDFMLDVAATIAHSALGRREIGRASCRERVEMSVVAVSLKKKKSKKVAIRREYGVDPFEFFFPNQRRFRNFFFSSRRRHTRWTGDWSSDVCSSD